MPIDPKVLDAIRFARASASDQLCQVSEVLADTKNALVVMTKERDTLYTALKAVDESDGEPRLRAEIVGLREQLRVVREALQRAFLDDKCPFSDCRGCDCIQCTCRRALATIDQPTAQEVDDDGLPTIAEMSGLLDGEQCAAITAGRDNWPTAQERKEFRIHWTWDDGRETNCQPEPEAVVDMELDCIRKGIEGVDDSMVTNPRKQFRIPAVPAGPWQDAEPGK